MKRGTYGNGSTATPFVNGAKNLGEALRRIEEGCAMIRTKGEPGTGNVAEAVTHIKMLNNEIRRLSSIYKDSQELVKAARELKVSLALARRNGIFRQTTSCKFRCWGNFYSC